MIFVILAVFTLSIAWGVWALAYRSLVPASKWSKFAESFSLTGLYAGGFLAGNFGSQLVRMILALS